jgi:ribosome-interacting GTPase 1
VVDLGSDEALEQVETVRERLAAMHVHLVGREPEERDTFHLYRRTMLVGNKADADGAAERLEVLRELYGEEFPIVTVSARTGAGLEEFRRAVWDFLDVIRAYTKVPGKKPDLNQPFVLPRGSTVLDLASAIHKDFVEGLKFARIWGVDAHDGQTVARDHVLHEGDVLELHL